MSPCRSPGSSSNSRSRQDSCGTTPVPCPVRKKAAVVVLFLCGKKNGPPQNRSCALKLYIRTFFSTSYSLGIWQKRNPYFTRCLPVPLIHLHYLKPLPTTPPLEQERLRSLSTLNPSTHLQPLVNSSSDRTERNLKTSSNKRKMYDGVGATKHSSELPHRNNYPCEMGSLLSRVSWRVTVKASSQHFFHKPYYLFLPSQLSLSLSLSLWRNPRSPPPPPAQKATVPRKKPEPKFSAKRNSCIAHLCKGQEEQDWKWFSTPVAMVTNIKRAKIDAARHQRNGRASS